MASAYKIVISPEDRGCYYVKGDAEACHAASEVLQENLEKYNIMFSETPPRHNHIVHYFLSIYGLGASAEEIHEIMKRERAYQMPLYPVNEADLRALENGKDFDRLFDKPANYGTFLLFFQRQIEAKGVKAVLEEHLFAQNEHGKNMWARAFASIFHPIIHLTYALEFSQPALVAETLANTATHEIDPAPVLKFMAAVDELSAKPGTPGTKSLRQLYTEMREDPQIISAAEGHWADGGYNLADNNPKSLAQIVSQYTVSPEQVEDRFTEMIDTICCSIACPVTVPDEPWRPDFWLLHSVNILATMQSLLHHEWLSPENSLRLFQDIGRIHLLTYGGEKCPPVSTDYFANIQQVMSWDEIIESAISHPEDDGHLHKCVRTLVWASERLSRVPKVDDLLIGQDEGWRKLGTLGDVILCHA